MILTLAVGFLGVTGVLWTVIFIYAFLSNAFFLVRLLYVSTPKSVFLILMFIASVSSLCCPAWRVQRTAYSRNRNPQLSSASTPYRFLVLGGRHADPLYGMVSDDIIWKNRLSVFVVGYFVLYTMVAFFLKKF